MNTVDSRSAFATLGVKPAANKKLRIHEVRSRRDAKAFLELPWTIYRNDPNWVAPLRFMRAQSFASTQPFFSHAIWRRWLAFYGDQVVGSISAQVDALSLSYRGDNTGYFGCLEAIDDGAVFHSLTIAAEQWLRDQGLSRIVGPLTLSINQETGLLVEGFSTPPNMMMGHAPPYYGSRLEEMGYQHAANLLAYEVAPDFVAPEVLTALQRRIAKRLRVRPLQNKTHDLAIMRSIFNDAWANNWGFVPFTEEEFRTIGNEMLLISPKELIQIAEVDGEPAAFIVMLPNLNEAIADLNGRLLPFGWLKVLYRLKVRYPQSARVPLMGVRQRFQRTPMGPSLAFAVIDAVRHVAVRLGIKRVEMSWILEQNEGMRHIIDAIGGVVNKRYRVYERPLVGPGSSLHPTGVFSQ